MSDAGYGLRVLQSPYYEEMLRLLEEKKFDELKKVAEKAGFRNIEKVKNELWVSHVIRGISR
jgi:hypothetical protein